MGYRQPRRGHGDYRFCRGGPDRARLDRKPFRGGRQPCGHPHREPGTLQPRLRPHVRPHPGNLRKPCPPRLQDRRISYRRAAYRSFIRALEAVDDLISFPGLHDGGTHPLLRVRDGRIRTHSLFQKPRKGRRILLPAGRQNCHKRFLREGLHPQLLHRPPGPRDGQKLRSALVRTSGSRRPEDCPRRTGTAEAVERQAQDFLVQRKGTSPGISRQAS